MLFSFPMEKGLKITAIVLFLLIMGFFVFQAWLGHKVASVIEEKASQFDGGGI